MKSKYKFKPNRLMIAITLIIAIILINMTIYVFKSTQWIHIIPTTIAILLVLYCLIRMPISTTITSSSICIKRICGATLIKDIKKIEAVNKAHVKTSLRTFGNGGAFGFTGKYYSPEIGHYNLIAVNFQELAKITTNKGKVFIINYPTDLLNQEN